MSGGAIRSCSRHWAHQTDAERDDGDVPQAGVLEVAAGCIRNRKGSSISYLLEKLAEFSAPYSKD